MNPLSLGSLEWWIAVFGLLSTLAVFSFLYRENVFYRVFEHLYIGIAAAIGVVATLKYFLWPEVIKPLCGFDMVVFPDGTTALPYDRRNLLFLLPMSFGMLYYFILSRRRAWLAQLVIGFTLGIGGGNAFKALLNELLPQLKDSFRPLFLPGDFATSVSNVVFIVTLVCSMSYFFFTFRRAPHGIAARSSSAGRYLMMCCFGAFFGATIMARMALLVERLQFILEDGRRAVLQLLVGIF